MSEIKLISDFFTAIADDSRISKTHISLYMALLKLWDENGCKGKMRVFSKMVMPICKISGIATYCKAMNDLHKFGYIQYIPSYYGATGSIVIIRPLKQPDIPDAV